MRVSFRAFRPYPRARSRVVGLAKVVPYPAHVTTSTITAVGILSPGEMGSGVGTVLHQHGLRVLTCLAGRGPESRERAARAGFEDRPDLESLVRDCDVLLSILPPAVAGAGADQVAAAVS